MVTEKIFTEQMLIWRLAYVGATAGGLAGALIGFLEDEHGPAFGALKGMYIGMGVGAMFTPIAGLYYGGFCQIYDVAGRPGIGPALIYGCILSPLVGAVAGIIGGMIGGFCGRLIAIVADMVFPKPKSHLPGLKTAAPGSVADELTKFSKLKDNGVISEEEFKKKKKELLGD